ncbi:1-acyl-sn-glycerol-3-phosphate acyltransferase [Shimazuella sp. AN120528]|uniref:lysophospholipid acyltransferase family protein n=1 Tax=Shimazuella soli TaxID=1892854 RepID=UPI001F10A2AF|nr:lysophospholipid acyltransferase family protein [Shimazuella soli]MCH5583704.1 1-acyl-sn-glycerol-3-phosphate acyltransferase [Shimazuella soli]
MKEIKKTFKGIKQLPIWIVHFLMGGNLTITISEELETYLEMSHKKEGMILAINHSSYLDPPTVKFASMCLGFYPKFMAKASLWTHPLLWWIFRYGNYIPVRRDSPQAKDALQNACDHLKSGGTIAIYFEGGIPEWDGIEDRKPKNWKTGPARLQNETRAVIIPVIQLGSRQVMSGRGVKSLLRVATAWFRRPRRHVHFGPPIKPVQQYPISDSIKRDTKRLQSIYEALWDDLNPESLIK